MSDAWVMEEQKLIPEGVILLARLDNLEASSYEYDGKEIHKLRWTFELMDDEYKGRRVNTDTTAKLSTHPNNKFRAIAEALMQREIPVDFKVCREDLVNLNCRLTVTHVPDKKEPKTLWERIDVVMPVGDYFDSAPPF